LVVSCTVFEISTHKARKYFPPIHPWWMPLLRENLTEFLD